ncbi:hypothetical protein [Spirilliplanes yamanashiensis]|uniref:hypothetical protein n=1 Tax=Spirilliplanes yamanashiensis TaxID=42233 RepID=UPI0019506188|nr:hypothetical protein [Spirilliplanes yamanashiensis]MDP9816783.1 hypothetical protein [Spirilliplanes yamanashiensis]
MAKPHDTHGRRHDAIVMFAGLAVAAAHRLNAVTRKRGALEQPCLYCRLVTSFPAQARRVRDEQLAPHQRMPALRECVLHFGPYGFRATWHHLMLTARVPQDLDADPNSLVRAVVELEKARAVWLEHRDTFTERRRREKAEGRRSPRRSEGWYSWAGRLAFCPDPMRHPSEPLPIVMERLIGAYITGDAWSLRCPVCAGDRAASEPCPACGVAPPGLAIALPTNLQHRIARDWHQIWQRTGLPVDGAVGRRETAATRAGSPA